MTKSIDNTPNIKPQSKPLSDKNRYLTIYQNNATNQASRLNSKRNVKHTLTDTKVSFKDISGYFNGSSFGVPEAQLFDYVVYRYASMSNHDNKLAVSFSMKDYMNDRGLKDRKSARKALINGIGKLSSLRIEYGGGTNNKYDHSFGIINIFQDADYGNTKRGFATLTFSDKFHELITQGAMLMPYPPLLFKLNPKKDATSFYILRKLSENKRTNIRRPKRANAVKIGSLLDYCPSLPKYDEVMKGNKNVDSRIIEPFFEAVEKLSSEIDYTFIDSKGKPFNYEEGIKYQDFIESSLVIKTWKNYPNDLLNQLTSKRKKNKYKK